MMRSVTRALAFTLLCASGAHSQTATRKPFTLHGTVEQVDHAAKRMSVANEAIPGGMGAMTMRYSVEPEAILHRLKPGDRITATYFEGDMTLHDVRVDQAPAAAEQAGAGMALQAFEQMALAANPVIAQGRANARASAGLARQASLYPNPTVGYYGDEIRGGYYAGGKQGGFISQTIVTGGKLRAASRVAQLASQSAEISSEVQRIRVLNEVRILFYQVLANQRQVEVRRNLSDLAADATKTSYQLANIGQADRPDVLQAEVEQQQLTVSLRLAEQALRASWSTLAAAVGKPDLPQSRVSGDLEAIPDLDYATALAITLRDSPEVKIARKTADRSEAALVQARKVPIPDLQLTANLTQNYEPLETTHRPVGLNGGLQIGVTLPLFNRNQGNIEAAKAEMESAKQEEDRVKLQLTRQSAALFRDYDSARTLVRAYKTELLPRAEQAYQLYRANYRNMAGTYPQALLSQRTLFQLQIDYVQALSTAWQSAIAIQGFGLVGMQP